MVLVATYPSDIKHTPLVGNPALNNYYVLFGDGLEHPQQM